MIWYRCSLGALISLVANSQFACFGHTETSEVIGERLKEGQKLGCPHEAENQNTSDTTGSCQNCTVLPKQVFQRLHDTIAASESLLFRHILGPTDIVIHL